MKNIFGALFALLVVLASAHAADKIRVGKVEREVSPTEIADLSILKEAQREMGIK